MKYLTILLCLSAIFLAGGDAKTVPGCHICKKPFKLHEYTTGYVTQKGIMQVHAKHAFEAYEKAKYKQLEEIYQRVK